jgi:D-alanyl-D-alanine carboxypeptidase
MIMVWLNRRAPAMTEKSRKSEQPDLAARIEEIMSRPEFQNGRWGMKFHDPTTNRIIYSINSDQLFHPASSMKVFPREQPSMRSDLVISFVPGFIAPARWSGVF